MVTCVLVRRRHFSVRLFTSLVLCSVAALAVSGQDDVRSVPNDGPRDMLRVMQVDDSLLSFLQDDRPLAGEEHETLLRLLFRLPGFAAADVARWTHPLDDWHVLLDDPARWRYEFFEFMGDAVAIQSRPVIPEMASRLAFREYYELTVRDKEQLATVFVRWIPAAWRPWLDAAGFPPQSVRVRGMFLKRMQMDGSAALVFAAERVGWHPQQREQELGVGDDQVLLGQLGLDVSRLEEVRQKEGMTGADRECFYQALAAVEKASPEMLTRTGRRTFDIARLINSPEQAAGELYTLEGRARRAIMVRVEDADIRARFGIDHYYEVEIFVPLARNVRFGEREDPHSKLFTDYPFVICVPQLPPDVPRGDDINVPVSCAGFFLKLWAYQTQFMTGNAAPGETRRLQLSPLLIGPTVSAQTVQHAADDPVVGIVLAVLFIVCLVIIWLVLWRTSVVDRRFSPRRLLQRDEPKL